MISNTTAADAATTAAWLRLQAQSTHVLNSSSNAGWTAGGADDSAVDLQFSDFFAPAGDEGLVYSDRIKELRGKRVRLTGFMVREPERHRGFFLLARRPAHAQGGACAPVDFAPDVVYVHAAGPNFAASVIPYIPGRLILTGRVEIGPQREENGRNSSIRLFLEELRFHPAPPDSSAR
jgi:hypothetical protein